MCDTGPLIKLKSQLYMIRDRWRKYRRQCGKDEVYWIRHWNSKLGTLNFILDLIILDLIDELQGEEGRNAEER